MSANVDHYREAERALDRADEIANNDGVSYDQIPGGRQVLVQSYLMRAQVHATLAHADAVTEASNVGAKALYDGRI